MVGVNINGYWIEDWKFLGKLKYLEGQTQVVKTRDSIQKILLSNY